MNIRRVTLRWSMPIFALLTIATIPISAYASATEQMKTFVKKVKTACGPFEQRQVKVGENGEIKVLSISSGVFEFSRLGRFTWRYLKPYEQVLQADGEMLYIYDKDLNQVTQRKLDTSLEAVPMFIFLGKNDIEQNFTLKNIGTRDGVDWVRLMPKAQDTQFQHLGLGFKNGNLSSVEVYDVFGNITLLMFGKMQKNLTFPAGHFKFIIPKGVDVIQG
nr:outer membrane lipoprotein chaperone LolA [Candidatus Pandoraea novymonadis]